MSSSNRDGRVLLFDVNETLLDLRPVNEAVSDVLLDSDAAALWQSSLLHHSLVMTLNGQYADFTDIGTAVLKMTPRDKRWARFAVCRRARMCCQDCVA